MQHDKIEVPQLLALDTRRVRSEIAQLERSLRVLKGAIWPELERVPVAAAQNDGARPIDEETVRRVLRARRVREAQLGMDLFADPAWDILLEAFAAELGQQSLSVSSLCIASSAPSSTGLRWIKKLEQDGWLERKADPLDRRRFWLQLSADAFAKMRSYFEGVLKSSLPI